ncbi:hypothetical protein LPJ66_010593 [Kickxella alabastrina]|uniref:Uncharacterized protein n=1 Tax=Kickxella alabastrina TaxID=61397 RepID=A0ACC1I1K1_9FUNG|nr:hypothetical protein LPJ66_010593 [Kickxella alabastrina]
MRIHAASLSSANESPSLLSGSGGTDSTGQASQQQQAQQSQQQEFRARTASESELGQFDGPASTHLALPLPSDSPANASSLCGRTTSTHYDVLGIVMAAEPEHQLANSSAAHKFLSDIQARDCITIYLYH